MISEVKDFEQRKETLIKKGKEVGFITYEELAEELKGLEVSSDLLDELYNALMENDISVISESDLDDDSEEDDGGNLEDILKDDSIAKEYEGGVCLILRLCPTDYHRFHFIDWGTCEKTHFIPGNYYSVNPTALERVSKLYCQNKREWCVFHSENFGDIIHVEVGATCVGSIIQTYKENTHISKGEEKGYFKFGGSTTILLFKPNTIIVDEDILTQSSLGFETKVNMGETIGKKFK